MLLSNYSAFGFFDQFEITRFVTLHLFGNFDISITNSTIFLFVSLVVFIFLIKTNSTDGMIIPGRYQTVIEMIYELVHSVVRESAGKDGIRFFPLILSLFFLILTINFIGLIPYTFSPTAHFAVSFGFSISIFIGLTILAFRTHGLDYFSMFMPPGLGIGFGFILVPIELVSYFIKPISLGLRLGANITAGHLILCILSTFAWQLFCAGGTLTLVGLGPFIIVFLLSGLEIGIAFIQAYAFCLLTSMYINDSLVLH